MGERFSGCNESRAQHGGAGAQLQNPRNIFAGSQATGGDNRCCPGVPQHIRQNVRERLRGLNMSTCFNALGNQEICTCINGASSAFGIGDLYAHAGIERLHQAHVLARDTPRKTHHGSPCFKRGGERVRLKRQNKIDQKWLVGHAAYRLNQGFGALRWSPCQRQRAKPSSKTDLARKFGPRATSNWGLKNGNGKFFERHIKRRRVIGLMSKGLNLSFTWLAPTASELTVYKAS